MLALLENLDLSVFTSINHLPHPLILIDMGLFFTFIGSYGIIWLAIGLLFAFLRKKKGVRTFWMIVTALLTDLALNEYLLKLTIERPRPYQVLNLAGLHFWDTHWLDSSFASGHSLTAVACAVIIGSRYPKLTWPLVALATLIAFSRVYLGAHWPSDVVAGAIMGLIIGYAIIYIENRYFVREKQISKKAIKQLNKKTRKIKN